MSELERGGTSGTTGTRGRFGIGEVLAQLRPEFPDISTSKIRFLESEGLIEPERTRSGYRKFGAADVQRLRHILTLQRDSYLPLRVIKERLAGGGPAPATADSDRLTRHQLLDEAGVTDAELTELEDYGLIRRVGRHYGMEALAVARAVAALRQYGVQARHLRAVKAAADREATLVEQVVAPQLRQRGPGARDAATRTAWQIADLTLRLHATLVESALADAGLASAAMRLGSYEPMGPVASLAAELAVDPETTETDEAQALRSASGR
ncbi:MAG: MerR family transcriptional regulator [Streptosporangiaceae bacterium]|nr:MerR family transcriptional regulator [Streptosporangiaceae bacterium]